MTKFRIVLFITLIITIITFGWGQSRETGAIEGTVKDEQGNPLPGVTVTISGPSLMGIRSSVTDHEGKFRFPALPPGEYTVKGELQGFVTVVRENIRLTTTVRLTVDLIMKPATIAEEVTVLAKAPTIDVKSTETASVTLANEVLRNIPYSQFTTDIVNLAPGVVNNVAYGSSAGTGIAWSVDGVNVSDPDAGTAWVFLDHNIIEEAKIMGIGLPAEYGNFTGVIFNLVTKTGGNNLSGHMEAIFQGKKDDWPKNFWQQDNNKKYLNDFPTLTSPLYRLIDVNAHLGGPIKKDKLWYYVGTQFQQFGDWVTGFPEPRQYNQPRLFTKFNSQLDPTLSVIFSLEVDTYDGKNRGAAANVSPEACVNQKSPEIVTNFSLTKILSPKTFYDIKAAYFWGYYYLDPEVGHDKPFYFSYDENFRYSSAGYYFYADRTRFQGNASLTHYAEDFIAGDHDFKFGVEIERSTVRNRYGYTGPNHMRYFGYGNPNKGTWQHYLAYQYEGYDTNTRYTRFEAFAQDSWTVSSRLNISVGLRFTQNWGTIKNVEGIVYNTRRIAPRIGFTFDIFGDRTTVLKAHYGQFTEGMFAAYHDRLNPASAYKDWIGYYWDGKKWVEFIRLKHEELYSIAEGIRHPYMRQYTVSLERELFTDASFSVAYIDREWKNIIGRYDTKANYRTVPIFVGYHVNKTFNIYELTTGDAHAFVLDNIKKGDPWVMLDPYRKYRGVEFLFNKRFSHRWQLLLSYVYSKAWGTIDNGQADDIGWSDRDGLHTGDPNFWINADGNLTYDPTHMLKIQGTYILPLDISLSAYFRAITGNAWTTRFRTRRLAQGRVTFFAEERGKYHYPMQKILDLRLEKIFRFADKYRFGIILDVFNVFNADTPTSWGTRVGYDWFPPGYAGAKWPSTQGHQLYSIVRPRQFRLGLRLMF